MPPSEVVGVLGVRVLGVFGSVARGDDHDRSDVPADREQHIRLKVCQLDGQFGEALGFPFCISVRDDKISPLDVAEIAQAISNKFHLRIGLRSAVKQYT